MRSSITRMRRADRLFLLIQALRSRRRPRTAAQLAEALAVSTRTIYRDIADLQRSGIPIEGEAGVGYVLRRGAEIPPLMFDREEIEALVVGTRFVGSFAGERLAAAARRALIKIESVLPEDLRRRNERSRVYAPPTRQRNRERQLIDRMHLAIDRREVLRFAYVREDKTPTHREVEPLCLAFWGHAWTLGAFCRLRQDFRNFRLDRLQEFMVTGELFADTGGRDLHTYLRAMGLDPAAADDL